jgi:hypothetical protein
METEADRIFTEQYTIRLVGAADGYGLVWRIFQK